MIWDASQLITVSQFPSFLNHQSSLHCSSRALPLSLWSLFILHFVSFSYLRVLNVLKNLHLKSNSGPHEESYLWDKYLKYFISHLPIIYHCNPVNCEEDTNKDLGKKMPPKQFPSREKPRTFVKNHSTTSLEIISQKTVSDDMGHDRNIMHGCVAFTPVNLFTEFATEK